MTTSRRRFRGCCSSCRSRRSTIWRSSACGCNSAPINCKRLSASSDHTREREAALEDYAALITTAQEEERRRLSRELHDDTAQTLVALSRGLDALSAHRPDQVVLEHDTRFIAELGDLAKRSLDSIRRACQDLRPSVLDDLGLAAALASLANSMTQRGLECDFQQEGESNRHTSPQVEVTVYRIAQEALTNALRHANATSSAITLKYDDDRLTLTMTDNGRGFSVEETLRRVRAPRRKPNRAVASACAVCASARASSRRNWRSRAAPNTARRSR